MRPGHYFNESHHCDIVIRSYYKDFSWLVFCLKAIEKYCRGFRKKILIVPQSSVERLTRLDLEFDELIISSDYKDDYLGQQISKLLVDTYTDAELICHVDPDCVFVKPTQPTDFIFDRCVQIVKTPCYMLPQSNPWQVVTERFFKCDVPFDFMQRPPYVYPRWLYSQIREHCNTLHSVDLETYILNQPRRGFSEFNVLGAYAYFYHREKFNWLTASRQFSYQPFCRWYWSWGGITSDIRNELEQIVD